MTGDRKRVTYGISFCGALLLLAPALAAAQDPLPSPAPQQDTVTIRAVSGTFELKGAASADLLGFTERCESKPGYSESSEAGQVATFYWSGEPRFRGVLAMLGVKYTLFLPDGTPVRATVNIEAKQAGRLLSKGEAKEANKAATKKRPDCSPSPH